MYTHGAPGAVLFPLFDLPGHAIDKARSIDRSAITGAMAIEIVARIYRRYLLEVFKIEDDEYLIDLLRRVREAGSL